LVELSFTNVDSYHHALDRWFVAWLNLWLFLLPFSSLFEDWKLWLLTEPFGFRVLWIFVLKFDFCSVLSAPITLLFHIPFLARTSHITNTCAQKDHADFNEDDVVKLLSELENQPCNASASSSSSSDGKISASPVGANNLSRAQLDSIHQQMRSIVGETFAAVHSEPTTFLPLPHCFELFGLDFLVDETMNVFLLEVKIRTLLVLMRWCWQVNASPDFAQTGSRLQHVPRGGRILYFQFLLFSISVVSIFIVAGFLCWLPIDSVIGEWVHICVPIQFLFFFGSIILRNPCYF